MIGSSNGYKFRPMENLFDALTVVSEDHQDDAAYKTVRKGIKP